MAKRWQQLMNAALAGMYPALEAMSDSELRNLRSAVHKMGATNCWWFAYRCVPAVSEAADMVLLSRLRARRKAKAAAKKTPNVNSATSQSPVA